MNHQLFDLVMYTDGACRNNGYPDAVAGCGIHIAKGHLHDESFRLPSGLRPTNQSAELSAVKRVFELTIDHARGPSLIYSDSAYTVDVINTYRHAWESNGFRLTDGGHVVNGQLIRNMYEMVRICANRETPVTVMHIRREDNQIADQLAKAATQD